MRKQLSPPKGDFISSCNLWRSINPAPGVTAFAHAKLGGNGCCADQTAQEIFNTVKESFMWCAEAWLALSWFATIHERTLRDTSLKVCMHWCRRWLLDDEKTFHHQQRHRRWRRRPLARMVYVLVHVRTDHAQWLDYGTKIFSHQRKYFSSMKKIFSDTKNNLWTTWSCCNSNMIMLGGDRGSEFGRLRPKRTLYISKQYHQGRNFLTPKTPLGGGLKNVKGTGNIF